PVPARTPPDGESSHRGSSRLAPPAAGGSVEIRQLGPHVGGARGSGRSAVDGPTATELRDRRVAAMTRWASLLILLGVVTVLALEAVPFYTDWLWFEEVGYLQVFLRIAAIRGGILIAVGLVTFLFLSLNLRAAVRARPPDVFWEL